MEASRRGNSETMVSCKPNTSTANMMAAIGALNMEDMAPAAAQPINKFRVDWFMCNRRAILALMAAPVATVGPSSPTDPPNPTVMGAVSTEPNI